MKQQEIFTILFVSLVFCIHTGCSAAEQINNCNCGLRDALTITESDIATACSGDRIVGGTQTLINWSPWMAQIYTKFLSTSFCGGSIISPNFILTAGHCVYYAKLFSFLYSVSVITGSSCTGDGITGYFRKHEVAEIYINPRYHLSRILSLLPFLSNGHLGDVAVLKLSSPIKYSSVEKPICLADISSGIYANQQGYIAGWGKETSAGTITKQLKKGNVQLLTQETCSGIERYGFTIQKGHLCGNTVQNQDSICSGDSGGPVWIEINGKAVQVGINSIAEIDCKIDKVAPNVFADVPFYLGWIREVTGENFCTL